MAEKANTKERIILGAVEAIPEAREDAAKLYSRVRVGTTTLAYVWQSGSKATRVDLYVPEGMKRPAGFKAGRGRARKDGLLAELPVEDAKAGDVERVVAGMKAVAEFHAPGEDLAGDLQEKASGAAEDTAEEKPKTNQRRRKRAKASA